MKTDMIPAGFEVREATLADREEVFSDTALLERLQLDKKAALFSEKQGLYTVSYSMGAEKHSYKMLFTVRVLPSAPEVADVHIAAARRSIIASRVLVLALLRWLDSCEEYAGISYVTTSCPKGKMANLANKLGFKQITNADTESADKLYFIRKL